MCESSIIICNIKRFTNDRIRSIFINPVHRYYLHMELRKYGNEYTSSTVIEFESNGSIKDSYFDRCFSNFRKVIDGKVFNYNYVREELYKKFIKAQIEYIELTRQGVFQYVLYQGIRYYSIGKPVVKDCINDIRKMFQQDYKMPPLLKRAEL